MTQEQKIEMENAMKTIGNICGSITAWAECAECPFDDFCTAINDAYWDHNWHDMHDTFCKKTP